MTWTNLEAFLASCARLGVEPPAAIARGLELRDIADAHASRPRGPILGLSDDEIRDRITQISIREHETNRREWGRGLGAGIRTVKDALLEEIRAAALPDLDSIVEQQQEQFAAAAEPITVAALTHGFTYTTNSDDLIRAGDVEAIMAWRKLPSQIGALSAIAAFRVLISNTFTVSPTEKEINTALYPGLPLSARGRLINHSVSFAAGDNWSLGDGFYIEGKSGTGHLDWLGLAAGGLRLNTPSEVRAKLAERSTLALPPNG